MIPDATPGIPPDRVDVDPDKLKRCRQAMEEGKAELRELGNGIYRVKSFTSNDTYQVSTRPVTDCHCWDAITRNQVCKHIVLAMIADPKVDLLDTGRKV